MPTNANVTKIIRDSKFMLQPYLLTRSRRTTNGRNGGWPLRRQVKIDISIPSPIADTTIKSKILEKVTLQRTEWHGDSGGGLKLQECVPSDRNCNFKEVEYTYFIAHLQ